MLYVSVEMDVLFEGELNDPLEYEFDDGNV